MQTKVLIIFLTLKLFLKRPLKVIDSSFENNILNMCNYTIRSIAEAAIYVEDVKFMNTQ